MKIHASLRRSRATLESGPPAFGLVEGSGESIFRTVGGEEGLTTVATEGDEVEVVGLLEAL